MSYSHMGTPTLPSPQLRFTSEFGMGSGGTTMLLSLDKNMLLSCYYQHLTLIILESCDVHGCTNVDVVHVPTWM